jgi:hypothetical protein
MGFGDMFEKIRDRLSPSSRRLNRQLTNAIRRDPERAMRSFGQSTTHEPVADTTGDWSQIGELVKTADIEALRSTFSVTESWDMRETIMVSFREVYRQHESQEVRTELRQAVDQALALCRAESSGGSYRENCIEAGERVYSGISKAQRRS